MAIYIAVTRRSMIIVEARTDMVNHPYIKVLSV